MLLRHSALYLLARGLPGLISLLAILVYTRLLAPDEYGRYALVIAGVGLANKLAFEWLRLSLLRFLPGTSERRVLLATLAAGFLALVGLSALLGGAALLLAPPGLRPLLGLGLGLLWVQALFELELEHARSQLAPWRYGRMALIRAGLGLGIGSLLAGLGLGAAAPLLGLLAAMLVALVAPLRQSVAELRPTLCDPALMRQLLRYGTPLALTAGLGMIVSGSDRFLIAWLLDDAATGRYAVSYDLASFAVGLLLMIVNLAAYPLAVRALEQGGPAAVRRQLGVNLTALLALGLPAAVGLAILARPLAEVLLGAGFVAEAAALLPLIALAALVRDLKAYYLDLAFQLGRRTLEQIWVTAAAALANLALNLWWIPVFGLAGAAWATVVAYGLAFGLSAWLGRRVFTLPLPGRDALKIVAAVLAMAGFLWGLGPGSGSAALLGRIAGGALVYGLLLWLLDAADGRARLAALLRQAAAGRSI